MLQFITQATERYSHEESAKMALEGGCKWIQLRMKDSTPEVVESVARRVKQLCIEHEAIFIVNDYVEVAKKVEADGVHLGKKDLSISEARAYLGESFIIGGTANTFDDVKNHYKSGADYVGCGPFRFTTTKKNLSPILGEQGYQEIISTMKQEKISIPIVAIGGIEREDISKLFSLGINGIALSGSVLRASNPAREIALVLQEINQQIYG